MHQFHLELLDIPLYFHFFYKLGYALYYYKIILIIIILDSKVYWRPSPTADLAFIVRRQMKDIPTSLGVTYGQLVESPADIVFPDHRYR